MLGKLMTKQIVIRTCDVEDWSLDRVIDYIKQLGYSTSEITIGLRTDDDGMYDYKVPVIQYRELETDEEYDKRIKQEQAFRLSAVDREKQEYERLKKKYG